MKKRLFLATLFTLAIVCVTAFNVFADYTHDFGKVQNGIVESKKTATVANTNEKIDGKTVSVTTITPNPTSNDATNAIAIDSYSWSTYNIPLGSVKYIEIEYKYSPTTANKNLEKPVIIFHPIDKQYLTNSVAVEAYEDKLERGNSWNTLTFDVERALKGRTIGAGTLKQMHFKFYGDIPASSLRMSDSVKIGRITFVTSGEPANKKCEVTFLGGFAKAVANQGAVTKMLVNKGSTITLPENMYYLSGMTFHNWIYPVGPNYPKYAPGHQITITEDMEFIADWHHATSNAEVKSFDISNLFTENKTSNYGTVTKGVSFGGKTNLLKVVPNTSISTNAGITLDHYGLPATFIDPNKYKYASIVYYYKSNSPNSVARFRLQILNNKVGGQNILSGIGSPYYSSAVFEANKWAIANFNMSNLNPNPNATTPYLNQFRLYPFYNSRLNTLVPGDELYISKIIFYPNTPSKTKIISPIIDVDTFGYFRPSQLIKKGEAIASIMRITGMEGDIPNTYASTLTSGYVDIPRDSRWFDYVYYLRTKGILTPAEGEFFNPDKYVTVREIVDFMLLLEAGKDNYSEIGTVSSPSVPVNAYKTSKLLSRRDLIKLANSYGLATRDEVYNLTNTVIPDIMTEADKNAMMLLSHNGVADLSAKSVGVVAPLEQNVPEIDYQPGNNYIQTLNSVTEARIAEIRATPNKYTGVNPVKTGKTYYVTQSNATTKRMRITDNAGYNAEFNTLNEIPSNLFTAGDRVLFERGGIFRGTLSASRGGVTYSSFGTGPKPQLYGSPEDLADASFGGKWELYATVDEGAGMIWRYVNASNNTPREFVDTGALFLIKNGEVVSVAYKEIPDYVPNAENPWRTRANQNTVFVVEEQLDNDLEFVQFADSALTAIGLPANSAVGEIYFRCDAGNPADVYDSIELALRKHGISATSHVTIDNLAIKYVGAHGVSAGTTHGLTVTNCEFGWIGGAIQYYNENSNKVVRFGNCVEIYGGLTNFKIDNCYIYEAYDAGVTHQYSSGSKTTSNIEMNGVTYSNNVIEYCTYNIEYFNGKQEQPVKTLMQNTLFENNILRMAGYGWGQQRPDPAPASIKGWQHNNHSSNFVIRNNIIDRSTHRLIELGSSYFTSAPYLDSNIYVQHYGNVYAFIHSGAENGTSTDYHYNEGLQNYSKAMLEDNPTFYYVEPMTWTHKKFAYHRTNRPGTYN